MHYFINRVNTRFAAGKSSRFAVPFVLGALLACSGVPASAQTMYRPASASTTMGQLGPTIDAVINGTGLSPNYISGTTNLSTYNSTHVELSGFYWLAASGNTTGFVTFDMGSGFSTPLAQFVFWNVTPSNSTRVVGFSLSASNDSSFSSGVTNLGSFTTNTTATSINVNKEVFTFATTTARYYRMQITSNGGAASTTAFGEAAFATAAAAPEPGTFALLALGTGVPILMGRKRARASK